MKRNSGLAAGLLLALTFVGVSNLPKNSESAGAPGSTTSPSPLFKKVSLPPKQPYSWCNEIADRLGRFLMPANARQKWKLPTPATSLDSR